MAEPSDKTKNSVGKMSLGGIGKSLLGGAKKFAKWNLNYKTGGLFNKDSYSEVDDKNNMSPSKVLGEIYNMMKVMEEDKRLNHEMANSHLESEELKKDLRNREIIQALTGRKKKKPVTPKNRREKEEEVPTDTASLPKGKGRGKGKGKGKEPDKETDTKKTEADMKKAEADKKAKDAADAKKAEKERVAKEKEAKRQKQIEKEKADAKKAQEEADKKTAAAKTDAERKAAERAKEEANRKTAAVERKAAEEQKKKLAEEQKKKLAEETTAKRLKDEEAKKTAEKIKAEKELARKKAEEEARRTAEQNKPAPPASPVSSSPIIPGISAAAATSISLEVGATTKESALQSVGKWVPNDPEPGAFSYGLFGINSKRRNGKDSSIDSFLRDNPQFNLPDPGNSKQFIKAWEKLAKEKPEEMYKAQLKWYKDRVEDPTVATLSKYVPKEIYSNPAVVLYMSDRANQYGPLANWTNGLKYAEKSKDYKEFLRKVSEYDKDHLEQSFKTYLTNNPNNKKGLEERIKKRLERALNLRVETSPNVIPNQNGNTINDSSIQNQRSKKELNEQQQSSSGGKNTTIVNQQVNSPAKNTETDDDRPSWYKKLFS